MMKIATDEEWEAEKIRSMARVFERADSILTGEDIKCAVVNEPTVQSPGFSSGAEIFFNAPYIGSVDDTDGVIRVTGLNFHELSHVMFTPRHNSPMGMRIVNSGLMKEWNILEDQRIESMLTAMYPSTIPYFVMVIMQYIAKTPEQWETCHILTHGRRYLPANVRDGIRGKFKYPDLLKEADRIIDRYRTIAYPDDEEKGFKLVKMFHELLKKMQESGEDLPDDPFGHSTETRPEMTEGDPLDGEEQESAAKWVEYRDDDADEEGEEGGEGDGEDADDADDEQEGGSGDGDEDGEDEGEGEGSGDSDSDSDKEANQPGTKGKGKSKGKGDTEPDDDEEDDESTGKTAGRGDGSLHVASKDVGSLADAINNAYKDARNSPEVVRDAKSKQAAMRSTVGRIPALDPCNYALSTVDPSMALASRGFQRELQRLQVDADPGWHNYKSSGRVNIGRAMRDEPLDTVWDEWDEGKIDATDIELVILLDVSSSMRGMMPLSSAALWAIKRAVEQINGEVTVLAFGDGAYTMYDRYDKAAATEYRDFSASGGTQPVDAIAAAAVIFQASQKKHKIAIFITDGDWSPARYGWNSNQNAIDHDVRITGWNASGIITACVFIDDVPPTIGRFHHCTNRAVVSSPADIIPLAKTIVKSSMMN